MVLRHYINTFTPLWSDSGFRTGLIVDDMRSSRTVIAEAMRCLGLATRFAFDGLDAFEQLQCKEISVVVTDLEMPRWSGMDLILAMRNSPRQELREMPVVVVSTLRDRRTAASIRQIQDAYFLPKPVSVRQLELTLGMIATSRYIRSRSDALN